MFAPKARAFNGNHGGGGGSGPDGRRGGFSFDRRGGGERGSFRGRGRGSDRGGRGGAKERFSRPPRVPVLCGEGAIFPLNIDKSSSIAYRYDVVMNYSAPINAEGEMMTTCLTKEKRDTRMRKMCFEILSVVMEATENFGVEALQIAYDNQNTLYASREFAPFTYIVTKDQLSSTLQNALKGPGEIEVSLYPNVELPVIDLSDVSQYESGEIVFEENQTTRQVLEIILTQGALNSDEYDMVGNGQLYRLEEKPIGRGLCTRIGTSKGIRMIEIDVAGDEESKKIVPALVVDFKCSPFYSAGNLRDKVIDFVDNDRQNPFVWEEASKFFNGCKVYPVYDRHRVLTIRGFSQQRCSEITIQLEEGGTVSLPEFYRTRKQHELEYPDTFAVNIGGDKGQFPMELLVILPNQRASLDKVPPYLRELVHRANAVVPQERYQNIMDEVENMNFNNEISTAFGIHVSFEPIEKASVLEFERPPKPIILVGNNVEIQPNDDGKFDLGRNTYFEPCTIKRWAILYAPECDDETVKNFCHTFEKAAIGRGIHFEEDCKEIPFDSRNATFDQWNSKFMMFKKREVSLVILMDSLKNSHSHSLLKLLESVTKVLTQHVTVEVARKVVYKHQMQTLGNILLKINVKCGGLNYKPLFDTADHLDINTGDVLVIGYDVSHPVGANFENDDGSFATRDPSVVGITANVGTDPSAFIGDFFFQATRQEKVDQTELRYIVKQYLLKLQVNGRALPQNVVILRDGVSEGQFKMAYDEELPAIQRGFHDFDPEYKPKFLFVICTKGHHKRFFEGQRGDFSNPQAGSFIEDKFTRPDCIEFFMQCHNAIKGTAKFVQVSVVLNELGVTKKDLFGFLHSLSYGHQIVCSPVSLPTPIYQADELAARGYEVYNCLKATIPHIIPKRNGVIDYIKLSMLLNYSDSKLGNRRFNA